MRISVGGHAAVVAVAGVVLAGAAPLAAQVTQGGERGVVVLRAQPLAAAEPTPAPAVVATPAPPPMPGGPAPSPIFKPCPRPFPATAATLGTSGFDKAVTRALRAKPAVAVVDVAAPFAVGDAPPAALTPWLSQVKASGGLVSADEYCRDSRGMFGWIGRMVRAVRGVSYAAADGYDAVLHVDGLDQKVTQVEFRRRTP